MLPGKVQGTSSSRSWFCLCRGLYSSTYPESFRPKRWCIPLGFSGAETRRSVTPAKKEEVPSTSSDSAFTGLYGRVNANNQWNRMTSNPAFSTGQLEAACISCSRNLSYSRSTHALHCHLWNARCGGKAAVWLPKLGVRPYPAKGLRL